MDFMPSRRVYTFGYQFMVCSNLIHMEYILYLVACTETTSRLIEGAKQNTRSYRTHKQIPQTVSHYLS